MKSQKIIFVAHCVLNQNAVVDGLARAKGAYPILQLLLDDGVGIIQLPCPELIFDGVSRGEHTFAEYNTMEYRALCRTILQPYIKQIQDYMSCGYTFLGVIGIEMSPSCAMSGVRGVLMEELSSIMATERIPLPYIEIPESYRAGAVDTTLENNILRLIRSLINET